MPEDNSLLSPSVRSSEIRSIYRINSCFCLMAGLSLPMFFCSIAGFIFEHRLNAGEVARLKLFKFSLSLFIYRRQSACHLTLAAAEQNAFEDSIICRSLRLRSRTLGNLSADLSRFQCAARLLNTDRSAPFDDEEQKQLLLMTTGRVLN